MVGLILGVQHASVCFRTCWSAGVVNVSSLEQPEHIFHTFHFKNWFLLFLDRSKVSCIQL